MANEIVTVYYDNVKLLIPRDSVEYYKLHRDNDLPAYIRSSEIQFYKHGNLHREGTAPAFVSKNFVSWWKNGSRHRDGDFPAIISIDQNNVINWTSYYKHNKLFPYFDLSFMISLQILIKIMYFTRYNKFVWSPNNLGGKFIKKQLLELIT
jgi:hypothetical protein